MYTQTCHGQLGPKGLCFSILWQAYVRCIIPSSGSKMWLWFLLNTQGSVRCNSASYQRFLQFCCVPNFIYWRTIFLFRSVFSNHIQKDLQNSQQERTFNQHHWKDTSQSVKTLNFKPKISTKNITPSTLEYYRGSDRPGSFTWSYGSGSRRALSSSVDSFFCVTCK